VNFKRKVWLVLAVVSLPLLYLLLISLIPENKIVGFHWVLTCSPLSAQS